MRFSTISALAALVLAGSALAAPAPSLNWKRDGPGPSGTLVVPQGGADWDNSGGFGLAHVVYQGVDEDYDDASLGVNHVKTHHIDLYLEAQDGSGNTYYLAKGIAPDSETNTVDEWFQVPIGYGGPLGDYRLVVVETQEGFTPGSALPITFRAAAPLIYVSAGPTP